MSSSISVVDNHHLRHPLPPRDPSKPLSKTRPLTTFNLDEPHVAAIEDRVLLPINKNLEPLTIAIHRGVRNAKARRAIVRWVRLVWTSKVDKGMDAINLKSSDGDDADEETYRDFNNL
ncbi:hypothetical protein COCNU_09G000860 [Cocos nucifera]|uniref:Uncharacterized protein n=1 Tax=Cocos nucifera TaxID=13894 RepID=A0A8K0IJ32_COCNU|nr:hypothetical protein COCNU_09G000860 [Cocos nucifera]